MKKFFSFKKRVSFSRYQSRYVKDFFSLVKKVISNLRRAIWIEKATQPSAGHPSYASPSKYQKLGSSVQQEPDSTVAPRSNGSDDKTCWWRWSQSWTRSYGWLLSSLVDVWPPCSLVKWLLWFRPFLFSPLVIKSASLAPSEMVRSSLLSRTLNKCIPKIHAHCAAPCSTDVAPVTLLMCCTLLQTLQCFFVFSLCRKHSASCLDKISPLFYYC